MWEKYVKKRLSFPPVVDLSIFSRHEWKVTAVLLSSFSAYTAISVNLPQAQLSSLLTLPGVGLGIYDVDLVSRLQARNTDSSGTTCYTSTDCWNIRLYTRTDPRT